MITMGGMEMTIEEALAMVHRDMHLLKTQQKLILSGLQLVMEALNIREKLQDIAEQLHDTEPPSA